MKKERVRTKGGFKGFGVFILGWFVGFLCTILILAGVGYWAYTSLSVKKIEKWTKTDITNNEGIEALTIKKAVGIVQGITSNDPDAYTIAKLEEDFGVKLLDDTLYGISLETLKNSPIKNLKQAFDDTIDTATFNNILSFMEVDESELGLLNTVLDSEVTYYVNNGKLYTNDTHTTEVDFNYTIEGDTVKFSNGSHTIASGKITPRLSDLPLKTAMASMSNVTEDLKIYEVLGYTREGEEGNYTYKDGETTITGIMNTLAGYTVGDLSDNETFNGLYVYEVMGYYYNEGDGKYYQNYDGTTYTNEVTGVLKNLVPSTLGNLTTTINSLTLGQALDVDESSATGVVKALYNTKITELNTEINNLQVYKVMGYYYNESDSKYYQNYDGTTYTNEVTGIMKAIAGTKVNDLSNTIDNLKAVDVFDKNTTTVLKLFSDTELQTLTVMDMPNAVVDKINDDTTTIRVLLDAGVIVLDNGIVVSDTVKNMTISQLIQVASQMP